MRCPSCGTMPVIKTDRRVNDAKMLVDIYQCRCGHIKREILYVDDNGEIYIED